MTNQPSILQYAGLIINGCFDNTTDIQLVSSFRAFYEMRQCFSSNTPANVNRVEYAYHTLLTVLESRSIELAKVVKDLADNWNKIPCV